MSSHTCRAVVVHCIDFRFCKALNDFFEERYPEGYDNVVIAGGVKDIADHKKQSFALGQIGLSMRLHHPEEIVLVQHEDCGAYGGSAALGAGEMEFQKNQLKEAENFLAEQFPGAAVKKYFISLSQEILPF